MGRATRPGFIGTESGTRRPRRVVSRDMREVSFADFLCGVRVSLGDCPELVAGRRLASTAGEGQHPGRKKNRRRAVAPLPHAELSGPWISHDSWCLLWAGQLMPLLFPFYR